MPIKKSSQKFKFRPFFIQKHPLILLLLTLLGSCTGEKALQEPLREAVRDGVYDSAYPSEPLHQDLKGVMRSVSLVNCIAHYESYRFGDLYPQKDVDSLMASASAYSVRIENESSSGTATLVYSDGRQIAILTCAHVVDYPDTMISYHKGSGNIDKVRLRRDLKIYITEYTNHAYFDVLAIDRSRDLAVLGKNYALRPGDRAEVLRIPVGDTRRLDWGSLAYLVGFPKGHRMVSSGLVSLRPEDPRGHFLVDALFNRGFSGGLVLSYLDGPGSMEWLGICTSVSADYEEILVPEESVAGREYDTERPYRGRVFIDKLSRINYGVTHVVPVEQIQLFLDENRETLEQKGFRPELFLHP